MEISVTLDSMFKEFFLDKNIGLTFKLFGTTHFALVLSVIFISIIFHKYRKEIYNISDKNKRIINVIMILILFVNMAVYYLTLMYYGVYNWKVHLPLHFCFISGYLFMYSVLFNKQNLYKKVYFFAFVGPIPAMLLPDLKSSFDSFLFYQQVISHHIFLLASLFYFYSYNIKIKVKDVFKAFNYALLIYVIVGMFNIIFKTNYIMQNKLPDHVLNLFPFLSKIDNPIMILLLTGIMMLGVALIPIVYKDNKSVYNQVIICYNQVRVLIYSLLQKKPKDHKEV